MMRRRLSYGERTEPNLTSAESMPKAVTGQKKQPFQAEEEEAQHLRRQPQLAQEEGQKPPHEPKEKLREPTA